MIRGDQSGLVDGVAQVRIAPFGDVARRRLAAFAATLGIQVQTGQTDHLLAVVETILITDGRHHQRREKGPKPGMVSSSL